LLGSIFLASPCLALELRIIQQEASMSTREVIQPHKGDKRYARRDEQGHFTDSQVEVGKSLAADKRQTAKTTVPKGQGDRGDEKRS
jgi:hypothetical protein